MSFLKSWWIVQCDAAVNTLLIARPGCLCPHIREEVWKPSPLYLSDLNKWSFQSFFPPDVQNTTEWVKFPSGTVRYTGARELHIHTWAGMDSGFGSCQKSNCYCSFFYGIPYVKGLGFFIRWSFQQVLVKAKSYPRELRLWELHKSMHWCLWVIIEAGRVSADHFMRMLPCFWRQEWMCILVTWQPQR